MPMAKVISSISTSMFMSSGADGDNNLGGGTGTDNRKDETIEPDDGDALSKGRGFYNGF